MGAAEIHLPKPGQTPRPVETELLHDRVIQQAMAAVSDHLGLETVRVARYLETGELELTHVLTVLDDTHAPGHREPAEGSLCWHVLQGNVASLVRDVPADLFASGVAAARLHGIGSHMCMPLVLSDGTTWGSFSAMSGDPDPTLSARDLKVMQAFGGQIAQRIEQCQREAAELAATRARVEDMLDGSAITIFHQPIHALDSNEPVGVECLARFPNTKKRGPSDWFDDAAKVGKGVELELAAVRNALETLDHVPDGKFATINVSPQTIVSGRLEAELEGADRDKLVIEVTDCQQIQIYAAMVEKMPKLKELARIAIDNVGTSYSSLRHIVEFQPDFLKMDMALTSEIDRDPARRALTSAMVQLARDIGCTVIAEGIESAAERDAMAALGVSCGQGYFFARPLPVVAAQQHLLGHGDTDSEPDIAPDETRGMPEDEDQPVLSRG